ncbi:GatB/YqeY domain-containing protein [Peribacillus sp. SCS-37]|uniref:GatB/YqeY domain-containing protein n=1 Tax=Paraperibacillus esterisolvens TaxID=3115296 RepID=UPI00390672CA
MSLLERLNNDMKQAMKNKEKDKLSVIRMLKAAIQNEAIKHTKPELTEEEELTVLSRELKQRKDSLQEFEKAGRQDLADKLLTEIDYVEVYLPEQLSGDEVSEIVKQTISETGASSKADMGKVMAAVMPKVKGKADGSLVNKLVMQHLSQTN